jgi:ABC-type dipeptide/oligopeptide/nickel transport system permease component
MLQKTFLLDIIFIVSTVAALSFGFLNYEKRRKGFDFYVMFFIGFGWAVLGWLFKLSLLMLFGGVLAVWGYSNKDKWDAERVLLRSANRQEILLLNKQTRNIEFFLEGIIFFCAFVLVAVIVYAYFTSYAGLSFANGVMP